MQPSQLSSANRYKRRARRAIPLGLLTLLCAGWLCGCGGDEENTAQPAAEEKLALTAGPVAKPNPQAQRPKVAKKTGRRNTKTRTPRRRKKPPGIPLMPQPEEQFVVSGNVDQFAVADKPFSLGESFIAQAPAGPFASSHYAAAEPKPDGSAGRQSRGRLPEGFAAMPGAAMTDDGWPERIVWLKDESEMVLIPAGLSTQGVDDGPDDARPQHQVQLDSYYMDVHEVTFAQYRRYRRDLSANKERLPPELDREADGSLPATGVRWGEAVQYARWVGKELPTEAEWEKAARGNEPFTYPWGNGKPIWHRPRDLVQIDPVASFRGDRSPFGVMDVAGNAREWCHDWYSARAYQLALDQANAATLLNPTGPRSAVGSTDRTVRVVRGSDEGWEIWRRSGVPMGTRSPTIGFRCVWRLDRSQNAPVVEVEKEKKKKEKKRRGGF